MDIFKLDGKNQIHDGIKHRPSREKALLDPTDTTLLLLDHPMQSCAKFIALGIDPRLLK